MDILQSDFPLKNETNLIINAAIEIHNHLGCGFLEIVYKDAFCIELESRGYFYKREKLYQLYYKDILLPHSFYADFIIFDSVILEIKAKTAISSADIAQTLNYLRCSDCKVGLILNFGKQSLEIKRVVL